MDKPREIWWIPPAMLGDYISDSPYRNSDGTLDKDQLHFIEYSAYKDIWKVSKMMEANYLDAKKENAMMREALKGLLSDTQHSDHDCGDKDCPVYIARKTLAKLKKDNDPTLGTVITEL